MNRRLLLSLSCIVLSGERVYSWDAENRLVAAYSNNVCIASNADGHMSRRVRKETATGTRTFIYDGWNLTAEVVVDAQAGTTNVIRYLWGPDLSGTLQGAGGVGGLLAVIRSDGAFFPCYDANGNVTGYVDANGTVCAHYEYSPFGETIVQSGDLAHTFRFRFSTKYWDEETRSYYYGYRHYAPKLGCWFNRDPIGINGGLNEYGFTRNNPVNLFDKLGLRVYNVPDCTYEVLAGHGFSDKTVKKYGGLIPSEVREKSQVPADIRLGKNAAATVVACNDLWYVLIRDADGWVLGDGGIAGYDRSMEEVKLLYTANSIQMAYDQAVSAARAAIKNDRCACKSGIKVKVTCFFTWLQLNFGSTGDVKGKCNLRTTVKE